MRRVSSALIQALECCTIVALGLAITVVPTLAGLLVAQGLDIDLLTTWRLGVDAWLLGHGVDLGVTLPSQFVVASGLEAAGEPFVLSIAASGIALVTVLLAFRSGTRLAAAPSPAAALAGGLAATVAVSTLLGLSAQSAAVAPDLVHAALLPAAWMLVGLLAGVAWRGLDLEHLTVAWLSLGERAAWLVRASLQVGLGVLSTLVGLAGALLAVALIIRQADVIVLFEALQPDHLGVVLLWLTQLALLPVAVTWMLAWMLGPGFAVGVGSSVSPMGVDLGPVPTLPLLGAIDASPQPWWLAIVAVPVLGALAIGVVARRRAVPAEASAIDIAIVAIGGATVAGLGVVALSALATGGIGPGRLEQTGPDALLVGAIAAAVAVVGLGLGLAFGTMHVDDDGLDDDGDDGDLLDDDLFDDDLEADEAAADEDASDEDAGDVDDLPQDDPRRADEPSATEADATDEDAIDTAVVAPLEQRGRRPRPPRRR